MNLVILAAGIGRRFGGLKQFEPVGPGGSTIMDYTIYDAVRAGFQRVVLVIRRELLGEYERLRPRYEDRIAVAAAIQSLDGPKGQAAPAGRTKPWGTAHATLVGAMITDGPFAVANADDFYGRSALAQAAQALKDPGPGRPHALIAYRLRDTLSDHGPVARGVCRCNEAGYLVDIREVTQITPYGENAVARDAGVETPLPGDALVSMNLWAIQPEFVAALESAFTRFMNIPSDSSERELFLPDVVAEEIGAGRCAVRVIPTDAKWCGVTRREDQALAAERLRAMVAAGEYPGSLWPR